MTENAIDEWLTHAIPPGSGRYYAILHAPEESKRRLQSITALVSVWSKLCFSNREIEVAQKKIDWWREELQRETSLHPITREFQRSLEESHTADSTPKRADLFRHLGIVLDAYGSLLTSGSPATETGNKTFHQNTGATSCLLLCNLPSDKQTAAQISQAGNLLSRLRCLRYLHAHVNNGLMCLPMPELDANDIKPNQFIPGQLPENARRYLQSAIDALIMEIKNSLQSFQQMKLTETEIDGAKVLYIYLSLQLKLLNAMQKNTDQLFLPHVRLSPLSNFWQAFRAASRFEKINTSA